MNVYQLSAKNCMSHLLLKDTFDTFLFIEGEFTTFNKFTISGYLQEDFFDEKLEETYSRWEKIRDFCFQIIRGNRTPLNFHYDGSTLQCITGTSLKTFSMDKSIEREWDTEVKSILKSKNIEGEY